MPDAKYKLFPLCLMANSKHTVRAQRSEDFNVKYNTHTVNCKFNPKLLSSFYTMYSVLKLKYLYTNVLDSKGTLMLSVTIQAFMRRYILDLK